MVSVYVENIGRKVPKMDYQLYLKKVLSLIIEESDNLEYEGVVQQLTAVGEKWF